MDNVLEVQGLKKRYGKVQALAGVDLTVGAGEVFGFLGPNGAGKTTFTKCVTGFIRPDEGHIRINGIDPQRHPEQAGQFVGLVPDQYDFYPNMTGREHLEFYGRLYGLDRETRKRRIAWALDTVRMDDRADRRVKGYSHGMKQRICIAQAIMHRPRIVILDEPTNGLDPKGAYELRELIRKVAKAGVSIFLNSHVLSEVEHVCERVAIVNQGRLVVVDKVSALRSRFGGSQYAVKLRTPSPAALIAVRKVVPEANLDEGRIVLPIPEERVPLALKTILAAGGEIVEVHYEGDTLEDVFLQLTEDA